MKNTSIVCLLTLVISATAAMAATIPAGWDTNPYYTAQQWSFATGSPIGQYVADPGYVNPNGMACVQVDSGVVWAQNDISGLLSDGYLTIVGPQTSSPQDAMLMAMIPNLEVPNHQKEVWVNIVFQANADFLNELYIAVVDDQGVAAGMASFLVLPVNEALGIYEMTCLFTFDHQPSCETLLLGVNNIEAGQYLGLDSLIIATQCVPEPATLALLFIGGFMFVRRRK